MVTFNQHRYQSALDRLHTIRERFNALEDMDPERERIRTDELLPTREEMITRWQNAHDEWQQAMNAAQVSYIRRVTPQTISVGYAHPGGDGGRIVFVHPGDRDWDRLCSLLAAKPMSTATGVPS